MSLSSVQCSDTECFFPGICLDNVAAFHSLSFNIKAQQAYNLLPANYLYDSSDNNGDPVCRFKIILNP